MLKKIVIGAGLLIVIVVGSIVGYLTLIPSQIRLQNALNWAISDLDGAAVTEIVTPHDHWIATHGKVERGSTDPVTADSRFRIASTSKTFLAVVTLQLAEEDKLDLDGAAAEWLPPDVVARLPNAERATIRQLLQMRSGIPDYLDQPFLDATVADPNHAPYTPEEVLTYAYGKPAYFEPGAQFRYTNSNYILLQMIVEAASGQPLHELLRERILDPLAMTNTYTQLHEELPGGFVHGYSGYKMDGSSEDVTALNDGAGLGDGALVSTTGDLILFYRALLQDKTLLTSESLAQMLDFQETEQPDAGYGLGLSEFTTPWGIFYGHTGGVYGYGSIAFYHPEKEVFFMSLVATDQGNGLIATFGALQAALGIP